MRTSETVTETNTEGDIFRGKEGESFSLPARGMTHLLPADMRMDGDEEEGDGQRREAEERGEQA